jgi:hypothetical protein
MSYDGSARVPMKRSTAPNKTDRFQRRRDGRVAEGGGLLNRYTG